MGVGLSDMVDQCVLRVSEVLCACMRVFEIASPFFSE